jgi:hypothetical protein
MPIYSNGFGPMSRPYIVMQAYRELGRMQAIRRGDVFGPLSQPQRGYSSSLALICSNSQE